MMHVRHLVTALLQLILLLVVGGGVTTGTGIGTGTADDAGAGDEGLDPFRNYTDNNSNNTIAANSNTTTSSLQYNSSNTTANPSGIIEHHETWMIVGLGITTIALLICLSSLVAVLYYRQHPLLKLAQPCFITTINVGAVWIAMAGYPVSIATTVTTNRVPEFLDAMCMNAIWWSVLGLIIVYGGLFGKLWRIKKVVRIRKNLPPVKVWHTKWPLTILKLLMSLIMVLWTFLDPPIWECCRTTPYSHGRTMGHCHYQAKFVGPLLAVLGISVIMSMYMANETRRKKVPDILSDGTYIYQIYGAHLVIGCVFGTLILLGLLLSYAGLYFLGSLLVIELLAVASIVPMILPKLYSIWYETANGNENERDGNGNTGNTNTHHQFGHGQVHVQGLQQQQQQQQQPQQQHHDEIEEDNDNDDDENVNDDKNENKNEQDTEQRVSIHEKERGTNTIRATARSSTRDDHSMIDTC